MLLEPRLRLAINTMAVSIYRILADNAPSIYLYGSVPAEDYRPRLERCRSAGADLRQRL